MYMYVCMWLVWCDSIWPLTSGRALIEVVWLYNGVYIHLHTNIIHVRISKQCSPQAKGEVYWEGVTWMEYTTTSKLLAPPHSHIKEKSVLKAYWANILHVRLMVAAHNNNMTSASSPKSLGEPSQCLLRHAYVNIIVIVISGVPPVYIQAVFSMCAYMYVCNC